MTLPLLATGRIGAHTALWLALPIGIAFGGVLERAGLGDPRKLAAQFTLTDMTVLKVMMTAIATAAIGLFWLGRLGWVDLAHVFIPSTFIAPQIVGGLVFGAGFVIGGYCPGTSCVAAAAGRGDALAVIGGMLAGTLLFAESLGVIQPFLESTPLGPVTWYGMAGIGFGPAVALLILATIIACLVAARIEGRERVPSGRGRLALAGLGLLVAFTAAAKQPKLVAPVRAPTTPAPVPTPPKWSSPIKC